MRKIIALLLVLATIFSLGACGKKKTEAVPEATTETIETTPQPPAVDMTPHVIDGKQAFWEQVFKKSTIKTASDSFTMTICDMLIQAQKDKSNNIFVGYSSVQKPDERPTAIYISKNKEGYVRTRYMDTLDEYPNKQSEWFEVDTWTALTFETEDDKKALNTLLQNLQDAVSPVPNLIEVIERIEYVHTINNQDYLKAYYAEIDKSKAPALTPTRGAQVIDYALYECIVNDEPVQFVYLKEKMEGVTDSNWFFTQNGPEQGIIIYDNDSKMLSINDTKYRCTMVVDYTKMELPTIEYCVDLIVDPKTQSICSLKGELQGVPITIEFATCEKAYDVMDLPFFTEEKVEFAMVAGGCPDALQEAMASEVMYYKRHNTQK